MLNKYFPEKPVTESNFCSEEHRRYFLKGGFFGVHLNAAKTQKARGIIYLYSLRERIRAFSNNWGVPKHLLFSAGTQFSDSSFNFPVFVRPCPVVPRHGFVDSIVCNNAEELNSLSLQTAQVEPESEILITKPVNSRYNAIINNGVITFADGNDGATSGKGCKYFYLSEDPLSSEISLESSDIIAEGEVPFYELVFSHEQHESTNLVQVRSAPPTPRAKDYIPHSVEVVNVMKAEGDLLDWEAKLKSVDPNNTIIDHTDGSLSSHYAIHAIVNKIPIFTSYLPDLGSVIQPTVENSEIEEEDREGFLKSFKIGFHSASELLTRVNYRGARGNPYDVMRQTLILALSTLHNFSAVAISKDYEVVGIVLGMFCRTAFAVSVGETRYGRELSDASKFSNYYSTLPSSRVNCYRKVLTLEPKEATDMVLQAYYTFRDMKWGSGYGGKKWASCTESVINLYNACLQKDITGVVELFNTVINEEHNGGKYLDKVIPTSHFDYAADRPSAYVLRNLDIIVDLLSLAWSSSGGHTNDLELISIEGNSSKASYQENVKSRCNFVLGVSHVRAVTLDNKIIYKLPEPLPYSMTTDITLTKMSPWYHSKLYSRPFWWTLSDGTRVISKAKLNKILKGYNAFAI